MFTLCMNWKAFYADTKAIQYSMNTYPLEIGVVQQFTLSQKSCYVNPFTAKFSKSKFRAISKFSFVKFWKKTTQYLLKLIDMAGKQAEG